MRYSEGVATIVRKTGPRKGRILELEGQNAEFFVEKDRTVSIAFYDAAGKSQPAGAQVVTAYGDVRLGQACGPGTIDATVYACFPEIGPRRIRPLDRELVRLDFHQGMREFIYGVVGPGHGAVAARIARLKPVGGERLLADLYGLLDDMALAVACAATALVQGELGIDQITLVRGEPLSAVEGSIGFFAAGKGNLHRALRLVTGLLEPAESIDEHRSHRLVVQGAATVEIAILLDQSERIAGPVLALGFNNVEMGDAQYRLQCPRCARIDGD